MKTMNSISGGKTSAYIAAKYPADYNVFSLVRINDVNAKFKDDKIRQMIEDRIQAPFIATAEDDTIIHTILDLEQFIGSPITWVTGPTFDEITTNKIGSTYLPNKSQRFCTIKMKIEPMFKWWLETIGEPIETRIGFRANETRRANNMIERCDENGLISYKWTFEKLPDGRNKWENVPYQKPRFPLIEQNIFKDTIEAFWVDKPVRFAWMNNCVGCFHRSPILLKKMFEKHPEKLEWFARRERESENNAKWRSDVTYDKINSWRPQMELFDEDFNDCDSGYCGL